MRDVDLLFIAEVLQKKNNKTKLYINNIFIALNDINVIHFKSV